MGFKYNIHSIIAAAAAAALSLPAASCSDDLADLPDYTRSEVPVRISLKVSAPKMQAQTRANIDDYNLDHVQDLWVRTYSATTHNATSEPVLVKVDTHDTESSPGGVHDIGINVNVHTLSGYNYVVAVANTSNKGFLRSDAQRTPHPLSDLLKEADTWEDFLDIAALAPSNQADMTGPATPLPMAGCYIDVEAPGHTTPYNVADWQDDDFQSFFIPVQEGVVRLDGAIHLRRLVSHVTFNIKSGDDITLSVNSFSVFNVPRYSWLYERPDVPGGENPMKTNIGDYASSATDAGNYYSSVVFPGNMTSSSGNTTSLDFWMSENKHTGNAACASYADREALTAHSFYSALCPTGENGAVSDTWTSNQLATYVRLRCDVEYKKQLTVDADGNQTNSGDKAWRNANVEYFIHLGYIKDEPTDFNIYRNCDYTFNVTINGVEDIRVEAVNNTYTYPGEDGIVNDLTDPEMNLDCHYSVFNIQLTDSDIEGEGFGFLIASYRGGEQYVFDPSQFNSNGAYDQSNGSITNVEELYNWIELRPASGEYELQPYKPRYGTNSDGKTFLLSQITQLKNKPVFKSSKGYYTVFVNKYTYEPTYTGTEKYANEKSQSRWREYVNQNPRRFYITTQRNVSADGKSIYTRSKYGVTQNSIQSYYSTENNGNPTAIGLERVNETEGMNMRVTQNGHGNDESNGRWNTAQWLSGSSTTNNPSINSATASGRPSWSKFVIQEYPQQVGAVTGDRAQGGSNIPAHTIAAKNPHYVPLLADFSGTKDGPFFQDPQAETTIKGLTENNHKNVSTYIEAINACMNRNRDNNGNGRIEPDELRWYVPAVGKYLRLIVGSRSLQQPLMNYNVASLPRVDNADNKQVNGWGEVTLSNTFLTRYLYLASNGTPDIPSDLNKVLWAVEGTSTSTLAQLNGWSGSNKSYPWQVRCIRNLGTDLTSVSKGEKVNMAYSVDKANRVITMNYYDVASIRVNKFNGNGTDEDNGQLPVHLINEYKYNSIYRAFEYAAEDIELSTKRTIGNIQDYINSNPCKREGETGWRMPNQKELAIMRNIGILSGNHVWLSCTASYFNMSSGQGGKDANGSINSNNYIMLTFHDRGTIGQADNLSSFSQAVRCVRDK